MASKKSTSTSTKKKGKSAAKETPELLRDRDIQRVKVEREVPVSVDRDETDRLAHGLSNVTLQIKAIDDEIAAFTSDKRKKRRELVKEQQRLANAVNTGKVMRVVDCVEERIFATMTIRVLGPKGELLEEKAMPAEMLQRDFVAEAEAGDRVDVDDDDDAADNDVPFD